MGWIFYFYFFEIGLGLNTYGFVGGLGWDFGEFLSVGLGWVFFFNFFIIFIFYFLEEEEEEEEGFWGWDFEGTVFLN